VAAEVSGEEGVAVERQVLCPAGDNYVGWLVQPGARRTPSAAG